MNDVNDPPISDAVPLIRDDIPTIVSAVLQSISSRSEDTEPSVQALPG